VTGPRPTVRCTGEAGPGRSSPGRLVTGAAIVAGHGSWEWPGAVLTAFGWLLVVKGAACWPAPDNALRSMARGSESPRGFAIAGMAALAICGWACYCLLDSNPVDLTIRPNGAPLLRLTVRYAVGSCRHPLSARKKKTGRDSGTVAHSVPRPRTGLPALYG
jgi:hypothetical protein